MSTAPDSAQESVLDVALREQIQAAYRAWLASREFAPRRGQRLMIAEIARTVAGVEQDEEGARVPGEAPHVCVVEAGTGTGKTVGYVLGGAAVAKVRGLKLVVATATVALQDQLVTRDLPDLLQRTPLAFRFALAKGRGRYACPARLDRHVSGDTGEMLPGELFEAAAAPSVVERAVYGDMLGALAQGSWDGDRESWERAVDDRAWAGATMDHRGCTGPKCGFFRQCPYFLARERVQQADVIVANHDLVLADLALGGGAVLPAPEETVYVFDEGHHLADKALGHLRRFARALAGIGNVEGVERLLGTLAQRSSRDGLLVEAAQRAAVLGEPLREGLRRALDLGEALPGLAEHGARRAGQRPTHRFPLGEVGPELRTLAGELARGHAELAAALELAIEHLRERAEDAGEGAAREETEAWLTALAQQLGRIEGAGALWSDFAAEPGGAVHARWVARAERADADTSLDLEFQASPLDAAASLTEVLWERCFAAVVTSATLTTTGGFQRFAERTGIPAGSRYVSAPSAFPYAERAVLAVPRMRTDPGQADAHADEVARLLPQLVDPEEGTLVIFTSWRQLDRVTGALPPALLGRVLSQATATKHRILVDHRARIDAGEGSVIFGLASFAEGIDLPGDYCRHVIITKLPFAVPDDPVEAALAEWLESQGRNPFMEVSVPDAALRLKQACGRLMRSERDSGRVTLLDPRLTTRRYGREILDVLPPFRRVLGETAQRGSGTSRAATA
ncbi:MAG: ATP-dependent DNA helicase DinG [Pseudomonadales bacterium]|jgi:ATP-dependent DNA helicase DinG|nr:ATP-dependent DNA helicase DinG [Pseudomonadales bacterium]